MDWLGVSIVYHKVTKGGTILKQKEYKWLVQRKKREEMDTRWDIYTDWSRERESERVCVGLWGC
jgi:hypothetical protein